MANKLFVWESGKPLEKISKIELYNLDDEILEKNNIADKHPEIIQEIEDIMKKEHKPAALERFKMDALGDVIQE